MNPETLFDAIHSRPFVAFSLRMNNDRIYHVDHPEMALLAPDRSAVAVVNERGGLIFLALPNIASLEPQPQHSTEAESSAER
jgi:hypothetical protein